MDTTTRLLATRALRAGAAGATLVLAAACADTTNTAAILAPPPADPLFTSYVSLGNSITAGYQSGGINDSTQSQSYAVLLARAMRTRFAYPALALPGCPPPIVNFQTQARLAGGTGSTCALRTPASVTAVLNNVAVPGSMSFDPLATSSPASNPLTTFILGGKSQVGRAADAAPTFFSAWIGNNDALAAAVQGVIDPAAAAAYGLPGRLTPVPTFDSAYDAMAAGLKAIRSVRGGVLIGVVMPAGAPVLFPARALFDPRFKAGFDQFVGQPTTILPSCTPTTTSLISFQIVGAIRAGQHPALIGCEKSPGTPVGDIFVLDAAEQASLGATVQAYNDHIRSVATVNGWAYWDPNAALAQLRQSGCIASVPNLASATQPFGACISLDGIHPSAVAHAAIAQALQQVINQKYGTHLGPQSP